MPGSRMPTIAPESRIARNHLPSCRGIAQKLDRLVRIVIDRHAGRLQQHVEKVPGARLR